MKSPYGPACVPFEACRLLRSGVLIKLPLSDPSTQRASCTGFRDGGSLRIEADVLGSVLQGGCRIHLYHTTEVLGWRPPSNTQGVPPKPPFASLAALITEGGSTTAVLNGDWRPFTDFYHHVTLFCSFIL